MVNFIAIKVRLMEIWDAGQRGYKGGKAIGISVAFANIYTRLITKVGKHFVNVYRSLIEDRGAENQSIVNIYSITSIGELRVYPCYKQFLMTPPKNRILILTILFALSNSILFGQQKYSSETKHMTVIQIDRICNSIDNNKNLMEEIDEGEIIKDNKNTGGYSTYYLKDKMVNGTLYRIRHESSTDLYYKYTFYYFDNLIIKASLIVEDWNSGKQVKTASSSTYYFDKHKTITTIGENTKYSNPSEILKKGLNYQIDFYKENDELIKLMNKAK